MGFAVNLLHECEDCEKAKFLSFSSCRCSQAWNVITPGLSMCLCL